jgi:hypothetical protein
MTLFLLSATFFFRNDSKLLLRNHAAIRHLHRPPSEKALLEQGFQFYRGVFH